jgi:hypothetical protein
VYPAYITWETYVANQARLANNRSLFAWRAQGAPRSGAGLLSGLAVCGRCGRQMRVRYKPGVRYICVARRESHGMPSCLHLEGIGIERVVVDAFFEAIRPAELALLEEGLVSLRRERDQRGQHHADQVKRAEYEARLAERQYRAVDPDNRLVAAELERRWELALRVLADVREAADRFANEPPAPSLDPTLCDQLRDLSTRLPSLWESGRLRPEQQKELLRSLIRRVVLNRPVPETVEVTIVWVSGAITRLMIEPTVGANVHLRDYPRLVERIRELSAAGHHDREIVRRLLEEGFHSAHRVGFPLHLVRDIRKAEGIESLYQQVRGHDRVGADWTVPGLAREVGMSKRWIYDRIASGVIPATCYAATGCYAIPHDPTLIEHLRHLAEVTLSRRRAF